MHLNGLWSAVWTGQMKDELVERWSVLVSAVVYGLGACPLVDEGLGNSNAHVSCTVLSGLNARFHLVQQASLFIQERLSSHKG